MVRTVREPVGVLAALRTTLLVGILGTFVGAVGLIAAIVLSGIIVP
jgi:hypothetical protein